MLSDTREGRYIARWIAERGLEPYLPPIAFRLLGLLTQLSRYTVVSALALAIDITIFMSLVKSGLQAILASVIGYSLGMTLHYTLSSRYVFKRKDTQKSEIRLFSEFLVSGVAGLILTALMIAVAHDHFGFSPFASKFLAVVVSFSGVFLLRRSVVFSARSA